ncbi:MAG: methyltransferase [Clostridia bacterium]|nr:methyltransferase [Clostridia bacterium]
MDKILVNVFVPVLNADYDIFLPPTSRLSTVLELVKKAVTELSDGIFIANRDTSLCYRADGGILNINLTVSEAGLSNGTRLMLI